MKPCAWTSRIAILCACLWAGAALPALAAGPTKIGYVDVEQVTQKAAFVKQMLGSLENTMKERQKNLESKQEEYARLRADIDRKSAVSSETELETMRKKAKDLFSQMDDDNYQLNKMLDKARKEQMEPALDRILEVVKAIGREEGFDLILRGEVVLYGAATTDITDKVIARLNSESAAGNAARGAGDASANGPETPAPAEGVPERAKADSDAASRAPSVSENAPAASPTPVPTPIAAREVGEEGGVREEGAALARPQATATPVPSATTEAVKTAPSGSESSEEAATRTEPKTEKARTASAKRSPTSKSKQAAKKTKEKAAVKKQGGAGTGAAGKAKSATAKTKSKTTTKARPSAVPGATPRPRPAASSGGDAQEAQPTEE